MGYITDYSRALTARNVSFAVKDSSDVDKFTVDTSGNTAIKGTTSMTGAVAMLSTLTVAGAAVINDVLSVSGAVTLEDTLSVSGAVTMESTLAVTGALSVSGAVTLHSALAMNSQKITALGSPTSSTDAATKSYVDSQIQGLDVKDSCLLGFSTNQTLASLTASSTAQSTTLAADDRLLLRGQTDASENGIYVVASSGAPTRAGDMAAAASAAGVFTFIEAGDDEGAGFVCTNNAGSDAVGTDDLTFSQFSGAGAVTAGDGMTKAGSVLNVVGGDGIAAAADEIAIDLATNSGMSFSSNKLQLASSLAGNGLDLSAGVMSIASTAAGDGLAWDTDHFDVSVGDGLEIVADAVALKPTEKSNSMSISEKSASFTASTSAEVFVVTPSTSDVTVTMPACSNHASTSANKIVFVAAGSAGNQVILNRAGNDKISNASNFTLFEQNSVTLLSNGKSSPNGEWFVI